ncbi:MAG: hypothetical protein JW944_07705, partial [Deltaproteobacteria bacterium]|nr:hypothetical protein [Deltaproteobacteria bacterium]
AGIICILASGGGDDGDDDTQDEPLTGNAILDIQIIDSGLSDIPPAAPEGFTLLDYDINKGTLQDYVWLYYKVGKADGSEGMPISEIYTVNENVGEEPHGGTKVPVSVNGVAGGIWLYYIKASRPVVRYIVIFNASTWEKLYGPPEEAYNYETVWVEELSDDDRDALPDFGVPADAQDLNEGAGPFSDYIYIGYGTD